MSSSTKSSSIESSNQQRTIFLALACVVVPAIAILSFLPNSSKQIFHTRGRFHSWGHLLAFSVIAYLVARSARSLRGRILFFIASVIFGVGIEVGEHLVFKSPLEWKDVLVDAAGVIGGTLIAIIASPAEQDQTPL